jgi:ABC-2 type transport system permease protein
VPASIQSVFWLALNEVRSLFSDYVMLGFVVFAFSVAIIAQEQNTAQEVTNATIAVADEDHSQLSRAIAQDFLPPYFKPAVQVNFSDVNRLLDAAKFTFVIVIPPHFESDVQSARYPTVQLDIDATAAMQAGLGADYAESIITGEIVRSETRGGAVDPDAVNVTYHLSFNPNATSGWFTAVIGIVNNVTMLSMMLCGAAVIREREHGTMDHLLTLPLSPIEIASAKVLGNAVVIFAATGISLYLIVQVLLGVPIAGSIPLFLGGVLLYLFYALSLGLFLATLVKTMPQFGLLFMIVYLPLSMLSGSNTPLRSEPPFLQVLMHGVATTYFVEFAQSILFRGAGFSLVAVDFLIVGGLGAMFFVAAVLRFRASSETK